MAGSSVPSGILRAPRCLVVAGGVSLTPIECDVHLSAHQSSDRTSATIALDAPGGLDEGFWADTAPIDITVQGANDVMSAGYVELHSGECDNAEIDWDVRTVHISTRDKTQKMLDAKTHEQWLNKTHGDIITDLAGRVGLGVQISQSAQKAGLEFKGDRAKLSDLDSYWNVAVRLAHQLGAIAFVKGSTLYIQAIDEATGGVYQVNYVRPTPAMYASGNFIKLKTSRDLNLAKDVKFNHKSFRHEKGDVVESEFLSSGSGGAQLLFRARGANLQKDQHQPRAQAHARYPRRRNH
jgi:hypothetical protein